ncbi:hypothetical protein CO046_03750 [Candidatus Peregrinibacteria bacterium CG_4_9_14_0_2_um_filter_53_11]|nr:MAG: hypothetical protein CO046_03750 [Candidatus Peregrinibacteria bacterium CG_4_9_14_0_2_um_filter_53_11]
MRFWVYMLRCADGTYYTGYTTNLEKRLHRHNNLKSGARYTKARRPVELAYSEEQAGKSEAMKREYELKQLSREEKSHLAARWVA